MSLQDADDIEKLAGSDFISPAGTISDAGLQSAQDIKVHVSRGIYLYTCHVSTQVMDSYKFRAQADRVATDDDELEEALVSSGAIP